MSTKTGFAETGIGEGLMSIVALTASIGLIAMLVSKADNVSKLLAAGSSAYNSVLKTAMSGGGNSFGG